MSESWITTLIHACIGLVFIILSIPLIMDKVKPNMYYGFRFPKAMADEKVWYEVNRIGGIDTCIAGAVISISALLLKWFLPTGDSSSLVLANTAVMIVSLGFVIGHSLVVLRRY